MRLLPYVATSLGRPGTDIFLALISMHPVLLCSLWLCQVEDELVMGR